MIKVINEITAELKCKGLKIMAKEIEKVIADSESVVSVSNEMTMREALKKSNWEAFRNSDYEEWNVTDLLNQFPE